MARTDARTLYLLHFSEPYPNGSQPQHYLGSAKNLDHRLGEHERGAAAALTRAARSIGITWTLARTWEGDYALEVKLKRRGGARRICPICQQAQSA